jgi:hypothetical protein
VRLWIRKEEGDKKPVNHLKASECNNSSGGCSNKVGGTTTVKSRETLLLKYFIYAINHTSVTLF